MTYRSALIPSRLTPAWLTVMVLVVVGGCRFSDAPAISGSTEEATVKGTVRIRGKPATNGVVSFRTSNVNRPNVPLKEAPIGKDGSYTVTTLVGQNFVEVSCKELFTAKNRVLLENEQLVNINSGENTLDIDLH
jgi:hypothetical protein